VDGRLLEPAAEGGRLACLDFLNQAGCEWSGKESELAAGSSHPEALLYCLQHKAPRSWRAAMENAISSGSPECMQLLHDHGYYVEESVLNHPARMAVKYGSLPCLRLALQMCGRPEPWMLNATQAAYHGEEMLRYVAEHGAVMSSATTATAARRGQLGALRYALESGAPWDRRTYEEAIASDSLECLKCAHQHESKVPLGQTGDRNPKKSSKAPAAVSLPVLRYVCEKMDPAFAREVVFATARALANCADRASTSTSLEDEVDWRMVLYLEGRLGRPLPRSLRALAAWRRERVVAFAFVLFRAGQLTAKGPRHPSRALWSAMARLPFELRLRIAVEADLV
jgi:hypothetical protein